MKCFKDYIRYLFPFIIIIFISFPGFGHAQYRVPLDEQKYLHQLEFDLLHKKAQKDQETTLLLLSDFYRIIEPTLAKKYFIKSKLYLSKDAFSLGQSYYFEGLLYLNTDKNKAEGLFKKAIEYLSKINSGKSDFYLADSWYRYAIVQVNQKSYPYIIKTLTEKSIPLVQKYKNQKNIAYFYTLLGVHLTNSLNDYKKGVLYMLKSIDILEKEYPNSIHLYTTYLALSDSYSYEAGYEGLAKPYLDKATKIITPYQETSHYTYYLYSQLLVLINFKQYSKALLISDNGIKRSKKFKQNVFLQKFLFQKSDVLTKLKKYKQAKNTLLEFFKNGDLSKEVNNRKIIYTQLRDVNELLNNNKEALYWSKKYSTLNDSIYDQKIQYEISLLETKYRTLEKEKEIKEKEIEIKKIKYISGF
ncbi:hypothetical protein [Chryseobacterium sp. MEBOG07]|uniref:hypothetical protein n=1 Tax=Chryseobacterium sp. MEBOG07 TaxID=2879939 RepID=UPI001F417088|nr:hypothetical protein [Chryseobacterium sp. MEBOG07]UKB78302.1 hypothetical protein LF886_17715 [Chryseobacterium sp. MEBOG07]